MFNWKSKKNNNELNFIKLQEKCDKLNSENEFLKGKLCMKPSETFRPGEIYIFEKFTILDGEIVAAITQTDTTDGSYSLMRVWGIVETINAARTRYIRMRNNLSLLGFKITKTE